MKELTARLWENKMYGTTYGKGQYRKAVFNGTLEIQKPYAKYLVDMEDIETWFHFPKSSIHVGITNRIAQPPSNEDGILMSWLYRYEGGIKTAIDGYAALDMNNNQLSIQINDVEYGITESWELPVRKCISRVPGKPTPALIATNQTELSTPQKPSTNGVFHRDNTQAIEALLNRA